MNQGESTSGKLQLKGHGRVACDVVTASFHTGPSSGKAAAEFSTASVVGDRGAFAVVIATLLADPPGETGLCIMPPGETLPADIGTASLVGDTLVFNAPKIGFPDGDIGEKVTLGIAFSGDSAITDIGDIIVSGSRESSMP